MDNRLNDALAFANYRLTLQVQRQNIEARVLAALLFSHQNAIFKATQSLIAFADYKVRTPDAPMYVDDNSGNTIKIENPVEFLKQASDTYDSAMSLKQAEQQKLKAARTTAKIVGL
jgi:hypothetical protein